MEPFTQNSKATEFGDEDGASHLQPLMFSTKSRVFGDKSGNAREPSIAEFDASNMKRRVLEKANFACKFCGFVSETNEVHSANDNHNDIRVENLEVADLLCHGWHHLGELESKDASIVYLPGLSPQDCNHLQRTIFVALDSGDLELAKEAKALLNWMASHRDYVDRAWGTYDPALFADALTRQPINERDLRQIVFDGLSVVFHPCIAGEAMKGWLVDAYRQHPAAAWNQVYFDVMNAPL